MRKIGFSTGALARGDFRAALDMMASTGPSVVELSALRDHELPTLMAKLSSLDLQRFEYVSVHVPSKFKSMTESAVAIALRPCIEREIPIVIHPDVITDAARWKPFGELLCIENMDKRKPTGRTLAELEGFFETLPKAGFCFDLGHARQVDSTMVTARQLLTRFGDRLRQVHISEVDAAGRHHALSMLSILAGQRVAALVKEDVPIVVESMVPASGIASEIEMVRRVLQRRDEAIAAPSCDWGALA